MQPFKKNSSAWTQKTKQNKTDQRTPKDIFYVIFYRELLFFEKIVGANYVSEPNFKPTALTYFWIGINLSFIVCIFYTLISFDLETQSKAAVIVGMIFQGITKYVVMLKNAANIYNIVQFLKRIYDVNTNRNRRSYVIIDKFSRVLLPLFRAGCIITLCSIGGMVVCWLYELVTTRKFVYAFECYVPFVNPNELNGFLIIALHHFVGAILALFGTIASDMILILFVLCMKLLVNLFIDYIDQLNEISKNVRIRQSKQAYRYLRNIVMVHQDICQ